MEGSQLWSSHWSSYPWTQSSKKNKQCNEQSLSSYKLIFQLWSGEVCKGKKPWERRKANMQVWKIGWFFHMNAIRCHQGELSMPLLCIKSTWWMVSWWWRWCECVMGFLKTSLLDHREGQNHRGGWPGLQFGWFAWIWFRLSFVLLVFSVTVFQFWTNDDCAWLQPFYTVRFNIACQISMPSWVIS